MRPLKSPNRTRRRVPALVGVLVLLTLIPIESAFGATSDSLQAELDKVAAEYGKVETQLANTEAQQVALNKQQEEAQSIIGAKSAELKARAGVMYKSGGATSMLGQLLTSADFGEFIKRVHYMGVLGGDDAALMEDLTIAQTRHDQLVAELKDTESRQNKLAQDLSARRKTVEGRLAEAKQQEAAERKAAEAALKSKQLTTQRRTQLQATAAGAPKLSSAGRFSKFTLPVTPAGFANTWGAPRSGGRKHQGTDVMSPCGSPVIAVTDGSIQRLASSGAGGTSLYLRASNGDVFFYAHLRSYASGISAGKPVSAGQVIGVNGNSGNARGGPCHVHFEWHPSGGRPVNPYPLLNSAR